MNSDQIKTIIIDSVQDVLREKGIDQEVTGDFHLFGSGSEIDSLDLVGIVVRLEEFIREETGQEVEIVDEDSIVSDVSPFRTVDTMTAYVMTKLDA
jgi:acyl carrier protein